MYTAQSISDMHERAHRSLSKLLEHCGQLEAEQLNRELPGFGYPCVRLQLHHVIGAEEYWVGVLRGSFRAEDDEADFPTVATLEEYRARVVDATVAYLRQTSEADLNTPREMLTWQGQKRMLVPALVLLRPITHIYQHQGQVLAQCRLLGHPHPGGLDFPLG
jgi:uncharacterized damage-inducible protein DinB